MGSLKTFALASAMALGASAAAAADLAYAPPPPPHEPLGLKGTISSGFYLRGDVGVGSQSYDELDVKLNNGPVAAAAGVTSFSTVKPDRGFAAFAGVGIGYQFNSYLRFDVTGEYRGASINGRDQISYNFGVPTNQTNVYRADVATFVALANAYIDLGTWNCLTPYLGFGIGMANHSVSGLTDQGVNQAAGAAFANASYAYGDSADKTNFAWALMAGVSYDVTSNLKLDIGYRYLNMGDGPTIGLRGANGLLANPSSSVRFKGIDSHDIRIGMRWNFSDPNCCGPVEKPIAYAPAPTVRKY
ncbi:MAG: outer membrane beta-barrel protein [Bosea sp. (in: a-proteobacteria)]|uniref:outer membrane protein n=1 Tax=Bosea sp. (in: a-proteobacteria) TaxID=1871050 RepID=UPI0027361FE3|nr:outer membrane beta-barrel protein [Bosea sp. (in: a-proteobacteria)]MDP3255324.1 outer membrane beta-barrel protein [Bosea sp. (in: a-proteobacteria)]MDP3318264.1 outer membrane beta-barrel protein [Bosea sp. (in: a-proteobacteria)]